MLRPFLWLLALPLALGVAWMACASATDPRPTAAVAVAPSEFGPAAAPDTTRPHRVLLWYGSIVGGPLLGEVAADLEAQYPDLDVVIEGYGAQDRVVRKIMVKAAMDVPPDLVWLAPAYTGELAQAGFLLPVDSLIATDPTFQADDFFPALWDVSSYGGRRYTLPFDANNLGIFYNKRLFAEAGITAPPATWDEFAAAARALTKDRNGDGTPDQYGFMVPYGKQEWAVWTWQTALWQAGGELLSEDGSRVAFNSPAGVAALTFWQQMLHRDRSAYLSTPEEGWNLADFFAGKTAMTFMGPWSLPEADTSGVDYGTFFLPSQARAATNVGGENLFFFRTNPEQQRYAWLFAKALTSPEFQVRWAMETGYLPVRKSSVEHPTYQAHLAQKPPLQTFVDQMNVGYTRPAIPAYYAVSLALGEGLQAAFGQQVAPAQALEAAERAANAALRSGGCGS